MFDELLHQGELQPTKIANVKGASCTGLDGAPLRAIGNHSLYDGAYEWTDGVAIYGNQQVNNGALPIYQQKDGVPVLSDSMKGYIDKSAIYHPYDIVNGAAITNSTQFCIEADSSSLDSEVSAKVDDTTKKPVSYAIYGGLYLWISKNIVEVDHAFHYMDADGNPYNPNGNVKTHKTKWYDKHHDNHMKWHESNGGDTTNEKKFDYYDYEQSIFESPFGDSDYTESSSASIVSSQNDKKIISLEKYASNAADDLKKAKEKILNVIGPKKYKPSMVTPSFILEGKDFWTTMKSATIENGKIFQDGTWWMLVKATSNAECVAWGKGVENKLVHEQEHRLYPDGEGGGDGRWDGTYQVEKHDIACDTYYVSRYGIAEIGITEYFIVYSNGRTYKIISKYSTPESRKEYPTYETDISYKSYDKNHTSIFGITLESAVEYKSYHAYQMSLNPYDTITIRLDSVPPDGNGLADVPIGDGYRTISDIDGTRHEIYDADSKLITSDVPFSATDNISACYLSTHTKADGTKAVYHLVGVHGKGIYLVENGAPTKLDESLRNFRLRYMKPISLAKAKSKGES